MASRTRDIYGRKPTSQSRGKTQQRIMDLQHDPAVLPGAETLLADAPVGSIGAAIADFHQRWVIQQVVTSRRAYERSLVLLARDLAECGPPLAAPAAAFDEERIAAHLQWRVDHHLDHPGELRRTPVHLERLREWIASRPQGG